MSEKTRRYTEGEDTTEKTQVYSDESVRTQTYDSSPSATTSRYEEEQPRLTDKTQAHHLGIGDSNELIL